MNEIFDPNEVLDQIGGDEDLLKELIDIFKDSYKEDLSSIADAIDSGNCEDIRSAAHRMKGSVGNFGRKRAFEAAYLLETHAREGKMDLIMGSFEELSSEIQRLVDRLDSYS